MTAYVANHPYLRFQQKFGVRAYPCYNVFNAAGKVVYRAVDYNIARRHIPAGGTMALEPRQDETILSAAERAAIDDIYDAEMADEGHAGI